MKKDENNVRAEINESIFEQVGGDKGVSLTYHKLKEQRGWTTPQPLYNVKNGTANLTSTTLHDIGTVDKEFSADMAIFGEYRLPPEIKEIQNRISYFEVELHQKNEEMRKVEIRAERAESLNEVLQAALKEAMIQKGINFQMGDPERLLADNILMIALFSDTLNKGLFENIN